MGKDYHGPPCLADDMWSLITVRLCEIDLMSKYKLSVQQVHSRTMKEQKQEYRPITKTPRCNLKPASLNFTSFWIVKQGFARNTNLH